MNRVMFLLDASFSCFVMFLHRIMHWARRIEQEIDTVFQHITGVQQLKGVSVWSVLLLIAALLQLNIESMEQRGQCAANSISSTTAAKEVHTTRKQFSLPPPNTFCSVFLDPSQSQETANITQCYCFP